MSVFVPMTTTEPSAEPIESTTGPVVSLKLQRCIRAACSGQTPGRRTAHNKTRIRTARAANGMREMILPANDRSWVGTRTSSRYMPIALLRSGSLVRVAPLIAALAQMAIAELRSAGAPSHREGDALPRSKDRGLQGQESEHLHFLFEDELNRVVFEPDIQRGAVLVVFPHHPPVAGIYSSDLQI